MSIHSGAGNILFRGAAPQNAHQERDSPDPPQQVVLLTATGGASSESVIVCRMR